MRRTTPDLVGSRKRIYRDVSIVLMALTIAYVLWTNYVIFVGGNLPLTSISLGNGSTAAGLTMLFVGDLIVVIAVWFLVDGVILNLVHMILRAGNPKEPVTPTLQDQQQGQQTQQWQPQAWPGTPPAASATPPAPRDGAAQATLLAPNPGQPDPAPGGWTSNDATPVHRRWSPPPGG
jgi:hypothetical protein